MKTEIQGYYTYKFPDEKERTFHFSTNAFIEASKAMGEDLSKVMDLLQTSRDKAKAKNLKPEDGIKIFELNRAIMYGALLSYCLEEDIQPDFNLYKVQTWIDAMPEEDYTKILRCASQSEWLAKLRRGRKQAQEMKIPEQNHRS